MENYKKIIDQQINKLDDTVKKQNKEAKKDDSLVNRVLGYTIDKAFSGEESLASKGAKTIGLTGIAYAAGVLIPIVSGATIATPVLVVYGAKKFVYDPIVKKRKE